MGGELGDAAVNNPIIFGAAYSVYTRIARLALEEKGGPYRLEEVDIFAEGGPPSAYAERNPFLRIPAFELDDFRLYETGAITRYIDDVFPDPPLMPDSAKGRGRVHQIIGILDSDAYRTWVWDIFVERVRVPQGGDVADENKIANAVGRADTCLTAIENLMTGDPFLVAAGPTLADIHAAPMIALFRLAPEGQQLLADHPRLAAWWQAMSERPSMIATRFEAEG